MTEPLVRSASDRWVLEWPAKSLVVTVTASAEAPAVHQMEPGTWRMTAPPGARLSARVTASRRTIPCRIEPGPRPALIQSQFGLPAANRRANALFDILTDTALVLEGACWTPLAKGEYTTPGALELTLRLIPDYYRTHRQLRYYAPLDKTIHRTPPSGWCSWYYYYTEFGEDDVLANARWMARELKPYGATLVQIDDGWQGIGHGGGWNRDFHVIAPDFPHGMRWLCGQIHALGLKAGLWAIPFAQSADILFDQDPDLWLKHPGGRTIGLLDDGQDQWCGRYFLDASHPKARKYLYDLFKMMADDWGYDYFKIDGQADVSANYTIHHQQMHDPGVAGADVEALGPQSERGDLRRLYWNQHLCDGEAYRLGLRAIRDAIGAHRFLLGCGGTPLVNGIGFTDGSRTGADVGAEWKALPAVLKAIREGYYLHNIVWYSDPDVLCVRPPLTHNEAQLWASLLALSGQMLLVSDNMPELPPDRVEILRRVFPAADVTPVDLYPYGTNPSVWDVKLSTSAGEWDVAGFFNYSDEAQEFDVDLAEFGLETGGAAYLAYDFWNREYQGAIPENRLRLTVPARSCRILSLRRAQAHPQVLSTSRHVLQGAVELQDVRWDKESATLSGRATIVADEPFELRIALPASAGWAAASVQTDPGVTATMQVEGDLLTVTLLGSPVEPVKWSLAFTGRPETVSGGEE